MSLMEDNKNQFSMEDFEKGLMLLGLITPSSQLEYIEKIELEEYEKILTKERSQIYFKRVVLAAEIVMKLREEPTFGRIKFQKLVYLCEHIAQMNLTTRYVKQAAGPFDNKFMHSINKEFQKQKWFSVIMIKDENYNKQKYILMENALGYKKYYNSYFDSFNESIQYILELFRYKNTDFTELAATIFACYKELTVNDKTLKWPELLNLFYNWSDKKKRFKQTEIESSFQWLREHGIIQ